VPSATVLLLYGIAFLPPLRIVHLCAVLSERDNARNNARCTKARKTMHGLDGQHRYMDRTPRERVNQNDRGQR